GSGAFRLDLGKGFLFDGGDNYVVPLRSRRVQHEEGELAIAGDETKTGHEQEPRRGGRIRPPCGAKLCSVLRLHSAMAGALRAAPNPRRSIHKRGFRARRTSSRMATHPALRLWPRR